MAQNPEITKLKLNSIPVPDLKQLALSLGVVSHGKQNEIVARLVNKDTTKIDSFIKEKYRVRVAKRQEQEISDEDLITELNKVASIDWGVVQGQLDSKIQREYVRKYAKFNPLMGGVKSRLHREITNYVIASWYNHWSTVLIEDRISQHPNVVPTLKNIKGVDIFFRDHSFDLKITYLPKDFSLANARKNPLGLGKWLYENQGEQRFGSENRFFVVVADAKDITQSWKIKRDINLLSKRIDGFLNGTQVDSSDHLSFTYNGRIYDTICKILLIVK